MCRPTLKADAVTRFKLIAQGVCLREEQFSIEIKNLCARTDHGEHCNKHSAFSSETCSERNIRTKLFDGPPQQLFRRGCLEFSRYDLQIFICRLAID